MTPDDPLEDRDLLARLRAVDPASSLPPAGPLPSNPLSCQENP